MATIAAGAFGALDERLRDEDAGGREAGGDGGEEVALRRRLVPGQEADPPREEGEAPLALGGEEALGRERLLQPLDAGERGAEPERLERERAQLEDAARLVELGPSVDVHLVAVGEVESQRVEGRPRHRDREARAVLEVLEREEDALPAVLAAQLGDLALDPDRRQAGEPGADRRG